jgi:hypothetical protein
VFHYRNGKQVGDFRKKWKKACIAAGLGYMEKLPGKTEKYIGTILHDLRRCATRNLSLSGVNEQLAMKITGHKTNSVSALSDRR